MPRKIDLAPVLKATQPQEAIDFFRQKGYRVGFDHQDVWQQEHQAAFTVAKAMQLDLLTEIRGAVDAALADGTTFQAFKDALQPRLVARGWWGKQDMLDPVSGETRQVQLGSPRRLRVIFDTNLATAYSEGQAERIKGNISLFPFLLYDGLNSIHPREQHRPWDGMVLRADDPWWQSHMPVKAWGCKCTVVQLTRRMMEREGYKEGSAPPEELRQVVNKRTGEVMSVPKGVDPAFHYPPGGRSANLAQMMLGKAEAASAKLAASAVQDAPEHVWHQVSTGFADWVARQRLAQVGGSAVGLGGRQVVGMMSPALVEAVDGLVEGGLSSAALSVDGRDVRHLLADERKPGKALPVDMVQALPVLLRQAIGVLWDTQKKNLLYVLLADDGTLYRVAVQPNYKLAREARTNAVRHAQIDDLANLRGRRFVLLDGDV